jgi:putative transferase (TIGR04331 family)
MKERLIVTTASENTWPKADQPTLFLGEWCRLYSRKHVWEKMDVKVATYHWDDRSKLSEDYNYLLNFFEQILTELTVELNKIHDTKYSLRYWRVIIGPWLITFIPIVFDRWSCLEKTLSSNSIKGIMALDSDILDRIPTDMPHFCSLQESDWWNSHLFSLILKSFDFGKMICWSEINRAENESIISIDKTENISSITKRTIFKTLSFLKLNTSYFIITPYLNLIDNIRLHLKLYQIPMIYQGTRITNLAPDSLYRKWNLSNLELNNDFERILKELIPLQMPLVYLEGYKRLYKETKYINWPNSPKLIWTSNSFYSDDMFKMWAGKKVENGVPLVIGQHGGHYGQGLFSFPEYHELMICDRYLSWGWANADDKVIPVGKFKKSNIQKIQSVTKNRILLLISGAPRYSGTIISMPISGQVSKYLDDQFEFYRNLSDPVSENVTIRLYPHDYEWSQYDRWKDTFPNSKIDNAETTIDKAFGSSDLVIAGWNATTYLESMSLGIPTVIFWNPEYFELREEASILFEDLKKVGIYHTDPVGAAKHVIKIWNDIEGWWNLPDVVAAKEEFLNKYALPCENFADKLKSVLKSIG